MIFRTLTVAIMLAVAGCSRNGISGPEDLGLAARFDPQTLYITLPEGSDNKLARNQVINQWLLRSDALCADYLLLMSRSIRDTRLATDVTATVLAGLATIFAQPAVTRPLSGAATIALGVGSDIQSDLFLQQAGDVVGTAIQAVRTRARTELQKKFAAEYADYTLEQGLVDVQRYDHETCNLNVGLNEIRASLNIIGPVAPQANNPIIPLAPQGAETGGGSSLQSGTSGTTAPVATTIIPPNVQNMPQGGFVFTPGKIVNTPAAGGAATTGATTPPQGPSTFGSRKPLTAQDLLPPAPPPSASQFIIGAQSDAERNLLLAQGKRIQQKLCLGQTGVFGPETRAAIQAWRADKESTPSLAPLSGREIVDLLGLPACKDPYRSPFEQAEYPTQRRVMTLQGALSAALKKLGGTTSVPLSGKLDDAREGIREFQKLRSLPQTGIVTAATVDAIAKELSGEAPSR
jgi:hypothetical protein